MSSTLNAFETDDEASANETSPQKTEAVVVQETSIVDLNDKVSFKDKMTAILSCRICNELRRCPIYQCKYGHLICAGCFNDILADSRMQNEIALCPTCQTTITKDFCFRNVAVEETISELPISCPHCLRLVQPINFNYHEAVTCNNSIIGCSWKGCKSERLGHEKECKQPSFNGYEILESLMALDEQQKEGDDLHNRIMELLSVEKLSYIDLQLKHVENENYIMETSKFTAFENQWIIRVCCCCKGCCTIAKPFRVCHRLILKNKILSPLNVNYLILPGPYNDMELKPHVYQFKFSDEAMERPYETLDLPKTADRQNFLSAKRINIRIFMFAVR